MIWHLMCHSSIGAVNYFVFTVNDIRGLNYFVNDNIENQLLQVI